MLDFLEKAGVRARGGIITRPYRALPFAAARIDPQVVPELRRHPLVDWIAPQQEARLAGGPTATAPAVDPWTRCGFSRPTARRTSSTSAWASATSAPGAKISGTAEWIGSSFSTALVSGTAALVWTKNPGWTNQQVRDKLQQSVTDLGPHGRDEEFGFGRIDACRAVDLC